MKLLKEKFKKFISGFLSIQLVLSFLLIPAPANAVASVVTINNAVTNDQTPALTGTIDDPVEPVLISIPSVSFGPVGAINNGDGTWSLPDNIIFPALPAGVYDVVAWAPISGIFDSTVGELTIDLTTPTLTSVSIASNNLIPTLAKSGDTITLSFTANEAVQTPIVSINGSPAASTPAGPALSFTATHMVTGSDPEGVATFTISYNDIAGNPGGQVTAVTDASSVTVDLTPPAIGGISNGIHYNTDVAPSFAEGIGLLNGLPFVSGTTVSMEGNYGLAVTDAAGNVAFVSFVIDKTGPVLNLNGPNPLVVERGTVFVDPGVSAADTGGMGIVTPSGAVNTSIIGDYTIFYDAVDAAGNSAVQISRTVQARDTISPTVDAGSDKITRVPVFQDATVSDFPFAISSYAWSQAGGPGTVTFVNPTGEDTIISADADGIYNLQLIATDAGSNSTSDTIQLIWDTTAPTLDAGTSKTANSVVFQDATTSDALSGVVTWQWDKISGPGNIIFSSSSTEDTNITADADGAYVLRLTITDAAGNQNFDEMTLIWDTVAPTVSNVSAIRTSNLVDYNPYVRGDSEFRVQGDVSDDFSGIDTAACEYTLDGTNWYIGTYSLSTNRCVYDVPSEVNGTLMPINIRVRDLAGNLGIGTPVNYTADSESPTISGVAVTPDLSGYTSANTTLSINVNDTVSQVTACEYQTREGLLGIWSGWSSASVVVTPTGPTSATCSVNLSGLTNGVDYYFSMRGMDSADHWSTFDTDFHRIVDGVGPNVDAGTNKIVNTTVNQDATVTDSGSGVASYSWTQQSGPGTVAFGSPLAEDTTLTADADGDYVIRLTVTDNVGNINYDEMILSWDTGIPNVDAGTDKITNTTVNQDAAVSDLNGIATYLWTQQSGPGTVTFGSATTEDTDISADTDGVYVLRLTVTDNAGNSNSDTMQLTWDITPPTVNAGTDKIVNAPVIQNATIDSSISGTATISWSQISGPGTVNFSDASISDPTISADLDGIYTIRLTVTDNAGNSSFDEMILTWDTTNPIVDAGTDRLVNTTVIQNATTTDSLSGAASWQWTQQSGPGTVTFGSPLAEDTTLSANTDGVYVLRLTVTDNAGNVAFDEMVLTWDTTAPNVSAGTDKRTNSEFNQDGTVSDQNGIASYNWSAVSGPSGSTITVGSGASEDTTIKADVDGVYAIRLTVIDNAGNSAFDDITLIWDTKVSAVSGVSTISGDRFVELSWANPTDSDFTGTRVYRSTEKGLIGSLLRVNDKTSSVITDLGLANGITYFYTIISFDDLGNTNVSGQIGVTPLVSGGQSEETMVGIKKPVGEVKSGESNQGKKDEEKKQSSLPMFGILILVILAIIGIYLLYLQNPEAFKQLAFWRREKK